MFCPNCAHENQPEIKFCTRCGTNLGVVAEALAGKPVSSAELDDRMVKLLTKYYDGRRSAAVGGASIVLGLLMAIVLLAAGLNQKDLPLPALLLIGLSACALVYGAIAVIAGVAEWIQSSSEMNALGYSAPARLAQAHRLHLSSPSTGQLNRSKTAYATDPIQYPIQYPPSVTEQTTRQLEERPLLPLSNQPKQTN